MRNPTYPKKIEDWYARRLQSYVRNWRKQAQKIVKQYVNPYVRNGNVLSDDAYSSYIDQIQQGLSLLSMIDQANNNYEYRGLARKFVVAVNKFSYHNVKLAVKIKGIDPISDNPVLRDIVKTNIQYNTSLIQKMKGNYINSLRDDIYRSITKGGGVKDIADALVKRTHMTMQHASLIANDQTGSVISQLDSYRATHAGAERYIWHSMEDNRVRPKHRELDGKAFKYDDPMGGDNGQLPGEPIRCRCYAEPIF